MLLLCLLWIGADFPQVPHLFLSYFPQYLPYTLFESGDSKEAQNKKLSSWPSQSTFCSYQWLFARQCLSGVVTIQRMCRKSDRSSLWSKWELKTSRTVQGADKDINIRNRKLIFPIGKCHILKESRTITCYAILGKIVHLPRFAEQGTKVSDF